MRRLRKSKHPRKREDITYELVEKTYNELKSYKKVAMRLHCSIGLVTERLDEINELKFDEDKRERLCSCCGKSPVWTKGGCIRLCEYCFKNAPGELDCHVGSGKTFGSTIVSNYMDCASPSYDFEIPGLVSNETDKQKESEEEREQDAQNNV